MSDKEAAKRLIKSAYGVLNRFRKNLTPGYTLLPDIEEAMVIGALKQHGEHLSVHGIEQKTIDAFKLVCWLGGCLLEAEKASEANCKAIIGAMLKTLKYFLAYESDYYLLVSPDCQGLLESFLVAQRSGNDKHGIWMNGLYMAHHCSLSTWKYGKATRTPAL